MYAIKDAIGQEAIDRALRRYLEKFRNSSRPYPVANNFLTILREEAGPDHQALISDLFDTIVLWEFKLLQANASPTSDGKWMVIVVAGGRKVTADASGNEQSMPLYDDVDIGLFETDPSSQDFTSRDVIALEKRRISNATMHFGFTTNRRPKLAYGGRSRRSLPPHRISASLLSRWPCAFAHSRDTMNSDQVERSTLVFQTSLAT